jgi:hypothetical protein
VGEHEFGIELGDARRDQHRVTRGLRKIDRTQDLAEHDRREVHRVFHALDMFAVTPSTSLYA